MKRKSLPKQFQCLFHGRADRGATGHVGRIPAKALCGSLP
jgi:hypothetical protein